MAVHAGVKRRFHQMRDFEPFALASESTQTSRSVSPTGSHRQASNGPNAFKNGQNKVETFFDIPRDSLFDSRASVVLIGIRGVGKSTLGVLGATAYNRRLIDSDRQFTEATGSTAAAYRKEHGTKEYQKRHYHVLSSTLTTHSLDTVIVCSFTDLEGEGAALLRDYGRSHPVIHITRDAEGVRSHLQVWTIERVHQLVSASYPLLRSCSNYEFFNLSEKADYASSTGTSLSSQAEKDGQSSPTGGFLTLKRVEHDFLRLIRNIIGDDHRVIYHHSAYPLSEMNIQDRLYTCAVVVNASAIINEEHNLDEMQIGADCVELVIDLTGTEEIAKAFAAIRRATILPILLTPESRPRTTDGQESLLEVIEKCLRLGPELCKIDISLDDTHISRFIARKGWNDDECTGIYNRAVTLRCDLVEITMPADSVESAFSVASIQLKAMASPSSPRLIAYETGINSKLSKCLNKTLTPVRPPSEDGAALIQSDNEEILLTAKAITQARFAAFMLQPMQFYVYGANVSYSLSPAMHNAAYEACGMQYTYEKRSSGDLEEFKRLARSASFGGSALAQPYKTMMIALLDGMSSHAQAIGAVNTIVPVRELLPDGGLPDEVAIKTRRSGHGPVKALYGFNTDWIGIRACIRRGLSPANTIRPSSSALVCGAGGMARSAIYSLISLGVRNIVLCNRTVDHAISLAEHYNSIISKGEIPELGSEHAAHTRVRVLETFSSTWPTDVRQPTMVAWCIPRPTDDSSVTDLSLPEAWLKSPTGGVVLELAYRHNKSPIARQIKERAHAGWIFMDGYDMIPEQAYAQFELFTGRRAPRKVMKDEILRNCSTNDVLSD